MDRATVSIVEGFTSWLLSSRYKPPHRVIHGLLRTLSRARRSRGRTMAAAKKLVKFTITEAGEGFSLHIEDEAGHVLELSATREQIDLIDDTLEELLAEGDGADEVKA
jgi:hypothetical protein